MTLSGFLKRAQLLSAVKRDAKKLFLAAMLCGLANLAHGAISTITVSAMLSPQAADFSNQPLSFQQFDPGLGKLQSVRVIVRSTIQLSQQFENTSDQDQAIHSRQTLDLVLDLPDGTTPAVKDRQVVARTYSADAFDGDIDFDGTSGSTTDYEITSSNQKLLKSRAKVAMFTGSGLANLFLSADGTFTASNKQNQLVAQAQALAGVEVQIIYNYIAVVPEPVAYGLAAGVLAFFPIIGLRLRKSGRGWIRQ